MLIRCYFITVLLLLSVCAGGSYASTQSVTAALTFDAALTISDATGIDFGSLLAQQEGTYTILPTGELSASNGGVVLGASAQAGSITISGSTTQAIDISAENYSSSQGVTPSDATCLYDGGTVMPCDLDSAAAPGTGKILLVGLTVDVDGTQEVNSTATPTFDIVVNYH